MPDVQTYPLPILEACRETLTAYDQLIADGKAWTSYGSYGSCRLCRLLTAPDSNLPDCLRCPLGPKTCGCCQTGSAESLAEVSVFDSKALKTYRDMLAVTRLARTGHAGAEYAAEVAKRRKAFLYWRMRANGVPKEYLGGEPSEPVQ